MMLTLTSPKLLQKHIYQLSRVCCPYHSESSIGYSEYNVFGITYRLYSDGGSFSTAQQLCHSAGMELPSFHSSPHHQALASYVSTAWLGARYLSDAGNWSWTDSSAWDYDAWHPGQPIAETEFGAYHCAVTHLNEQGLWGWSSSSCESYNQVVCTLPGEQCCSKDALSVSIMCDIIERVHTTLP